MIQLNDHYFVAWLNVTKGIDYSLNAFGKVQVDMTPQQYTDFLKIYAETYKPTLVKVRNIVKQLNVLTSKPKKVN